MSYFGDHVLGCIVGLSSGDAFGMPTEFLTPTQIKQHYGWVDQFVAPHSEHFHKGMPAGRITDDTGQALAILKWVLKNHGLLNPRIVADALIEWKNELGLEFEQVVGPSTRKALIELELGSDPILTGRDGRTNGAAMRAQIGGLLHPGDESKAAEAAYFSSLPTHSINLAIAGSCAVACAVSQAMVPATSLESILAAAERGAGIGTQRGNVVWGTSLEMRIRLAIEIVDRSTSIKSALDALYNYVGVDMIVAESVAVAIGIVKLAEGDPVKAITYSANIGGDTDTIGAIAGSICGAWKGITAFPADWLILLEQVNHLNLEDYAKKLEQFINTPI